MKVTALAVKLKMEPLSPSLSFLDFLNQMHIDFVFFLLRGQHEFILRLVSLSTIFLWCVEDHACTALLSDGAQSLAHANQALDC